MELPAKLVDRMTRKLTRISLDIADSKVNVGIEVGVDGELTRA